MANLSSSLVHTFIFVNSLDKFVGKKMPMECIHPLAGREASLAFEAPRSNFEDNIPLCFLTVVAQIYESFSSLVSF